MNAFSSSDNLSQLDEKYQKAAMMRASGHSLKEISNEIELSYAHTREIFAPNDKQRNQTLIDAVADIKADLASGLRSLPVLIVDRLRSEIQTGDSETSHHYIKITTNLIRDLDQSASTPGKGLPGIQALIQNFVTEKPVGHKTPPLPVVFEAEIVSK